MLDKEKKEIYLMSLGEDKKVKGKRKQSPRNHFVNVLYLFVRHSESPEQNFFRSRKSEKD